MNGWKRLLNLWKLSEFEPQTKTYLSPLGEPQKTTVLIKESSMPAKFIPRIKITPAQAITQESV